MNRRNTHKSALVLLTVTLALGGVGSASGDQRVTESSKPATCEFRVADSHRLATVGKHGLPVEATCDKRASIAAWFTWKSGSAQAKAWRRISPQRGPCLTDNPVMPEQGTMLLRPRLSPKALRLIRRYPRTRLQVGYGKEGDLAGQYVPEGGKTVLVVRD